jgi:hypothetical protein
VLLAGPLTRALGSTAKRRHLAIDTGERRAATISA